ncbi:MAG: phosphoribosylglycinamide formyltransferase [Bacteroidia bacterium]|nr:phosphoribosylglycinamide formyltransferase [Bacteroidia bacterium]
MQSKARIAIFASGSGTNAEEIFKRFKDHPAIEVVLLLSNNPGAYALVRAKKFGVPSKTFTRQQWRETHDVLGWLREAAVTHIVLAGFLWLVPSYLVQAYPHRIINIHPALLPKYGGKGMYGANVHEAVKAARETETGITIHLVNERYDDGAILFQTSCAINPDDWAEKIEKLALEASSFVDVQVTKGLSLLTVRHYTKEVFEKLTEGKKILLRQQTPETIQLLLQ